MSKRLLALALIVWLASAPAEAQNKAAQPRAVSARGALDAEELNNIGVFKRVSPSVVHITTLSVQRDFFSLRTSEQPSGTGTGFVWDDAGHIVTNFHVIQGGDRATVTLADQSSHPAKLVGAFPDRDIAVLRIEAPRDKLPAIQLGASRDLQVGQKVYAIGNPFGLDQTLTTGIVSALNREIESVTRRHQGRDPDRRGHQPGQLRRAAAGLGGAADRRQHVDLQPERGKRGDRVRDSGGRGKPHRAEVDPGWAIHPAGAGRDVRAGEPDPGAGCAQGRSARQRGRRQPGGDGRAQAVRARPQRAHRAGGCHHRCGWADGGGLG